MKRWFVGFFFMSIVCTGALAAAKGPEVDLVDNKLSINAEAISLSRLLQLVDLATGMKSKVPPELANRSLSVRFSNLDLTDGFRKMFQGQPFDYVVVQGQGIIIKAASLSPSAGDPAPPPANNPPPAAQSFDQPFVQEFPPVQAQQPFQQQPQPQIQQQPMVQTPFGPIPNPRAQQPQPNSPVTVPGQQNTLFPNQPVPNQPISQPAIGQPVPGFPPVQPNNANPFGTPTPFGTPNAPAVNQNNPNNGLFGTVPVFGTPNTQQR